MKILAESSVSIPSLVSAAALTWLSASTAYSEQTSRLWSLTNLVPKAAVSSVLRIGPAVHEIGLAVHESGRQVGRGAPVSKYKIRKGYCVLTFHFYHFTALSWIDCKVSGCR